MERRRPDAVPAPGGRRGAVPRRDAARAGRRPRRSGAAAAARCAGYVLPAASAGRGAAAWPCPTSAIARGRRGGRRLRPRVRSARPAGGSRRRLAARRLRMFARTTSSRTGSAAREIAQTCSSAAPGSPICGGLRQAHEAEARPRPRGSVSESRGAFEPGVGRAAPVSLGSPALLPRSLTIPSRSSSASSPRHDRRTRTDRSRCTRFPSSRSSSRRAAVPIALIIRPRAPIRMPFWDSVSTHRNAHDHEVVLLVDLVDLDLDRVRHLLARAVQDLLAHELGEHDVLGLVGDILGREVERALGQQEARCSTSGGTPRPVRADTGKISASSPSRSAAACERQHGARPVEPVDLVDGDHDRHLRALQRLGDEAVARPADPLLAVDARTARRRPRRARTRRGAACAGSARRAGAGRRAGR